MAVGLRTRIGAAAGGVLRRVGPLVLVLAWVLAGPVQAKSGQKKALPGQGLDLIELSDTIPAPRRPVAAAVTPARVFTINQVLAKRRGADGTRVAALTDGTASDAPEAGTKAPARGPEPFGLFAFRAPEGLLWHKWRGVQAAMARESETLAACRRDAEACSSAARRYETLLAKARAQRGEQRLRTVTHLVNGAVRYTTDFAQHGTADLWSSPLATLAAGRGDCEDYAILKYALLQELGIAQSDLRIVLLRDTASRQDHAVVAVRQQNRWFVLDNRYAGFYADADLPHYMPLFALNKAGVSLFAAPYAQRAPEAAETGIAPAADDWGTERPDGDTSAGAGSLPLLL